jgi:hypothetical protein
MLFIAILAALLFLGDFLRKFYRDRKLGWKVKHTSHDRFCYFEYINGKWEFIVIDRVYSAGSFYPKFKNECDWKDYPEWAQHRNQIIERISLRFPKKGIQEIDDIGSQ